MARLENENALNGLLINLSHSLLQYCTESWPWSNPEDLKIQGKLQEVIAEQHDDIQELTDFLLSRRVMVEFGTYPDYTDFNFLGIDFFQARLIENQTAIVERIERTRQLCVADQECNALLTKLHSHALIQLSTIKQLANVPTA